MKRFLKGLDKRLERFGKWLDNFIRVIAQHGKLECRDCGTFVPKGTPCRCRK